MQDPPGRDILRRIEQNPIISAEDIPFTCNTVFNGSPAKIGNEYFILIRVEGQRGYSLLALGRSKNGYEFEIERKPVMAPSEEGPYSKYEAAGIEDPRVTVLDGTIYVLYTAFSRYGPVMALARTEDFMTYERLGIVSTPRQGYWDSYRIGASAVPLRTDEGWLEIYHGVKMTSGGPIYRAGVVLLDLEDPSRVIGRSTVPVLSPREDYERIGDVNNVVFVSGAILEADKSVKVYYGAADTAICVATAPLDELVQIARRGW